MDKWRIWISIVLLLDAAFGLWNARRFAHILAPKRVFWIASTEAAVAIGLAIWHFSIR